MQHKNFGKVIVLMGGCGSEREVSLMSGANVLEAIQRKGLDVEAIDVGKNVIQQLEEAHPDRVFIALHGEDGEDGKIQAVLDLMGVPYVGSGVAASALAMNKYTSGLLCCGLDLPVIPTLLLHSAKELDKVDFDFPICIKPPNDGSSRGVTKVTAKSELKTAYEKAKEFDDMVIAQPWIEGRELTVSIVGDEALPVVEIITPAGEFYDYEAKYFKDTTDYVCPADITTAQSKELQNVALQVFRALDCRHFARVDFLQDREGRVWFLEANTIPGLTSHSLLPMAANAIGIEFDDLIMQLLEFTL